MMCQVKGCHHEAVPMVNALGEYWCGECLEEGTRQANAIAAWAGPEAERLEALNALPWYRKPGRVVPWGLFAAWFAATAYYPTMLLWWVFFIPVFICFWHWGSGN